MIPPELPAATFLVTGATGEVARPVVRHLLARGDNVLLVGRDDAALTRLAQELVEAGHEAVRLATVAGSGADPTVLRLAATEAVRRFGGLSGLVHLVGGFVPGPLMLTDVSGYADLLEANFLSAVVATQAVLPHLRDGGRLVYFSSPLVSEPIAGLSAYSASKAALTTWVRSIAHEVKGRGIHANVVSLTLVDTPALRRDRPGLDFEHTVDAELVASAVGFLTSAAADGLYGSVVPVVGRFAYTSALAGGPPAPVGGPSAPIEPLRPGVLEPVGGGR